MGLLGLLAQMATLGMRRVSPARLPELIGLLLLGIVSVLLALAWRVIPGHAQAGLLAVIAMLAIVVLLIVVPRRVYPWVLNLVVLILLGGVTVGGVRLRHVGLRNTGLRVTGPREAEVRGAGVRGAGVRGGRAGEVAAYEDGFLGAGVVEVGRVVVGVGGEAGAVDDRGDGALQVGDAAVAFISSARASPVTTRRSASNGRTNVVCDASESLASSWNDDRKYAPSDGNKTSRTPTTASPRGKSPLARSGTSSSCGRLVVVRHVPPGAGGLRGEGDPQGVGAGRARPFERSLPLKAREFASAAECGEAP